MGESKNPNNQKTESNETDQKQSFLEKVNTNVHGSALFFGSLAAQFILPFLTGIILAKPVALVLKILVVFSLLFSLIKLFTVAYQKREKDSGQSKKLRIFTLINVLMIIFQITIGFIFEKLSLNSPEIIMTCILLNITAFCISGYMIFKEDPLSMNDRREFISHLMKEFLKIGIATSLVCLVILLAALFLFIEGYPLESYAFATLLLLSVPMAIFIHLPFSLSCAAYVSVGTGSYHQALNLSNIALNFDSFNAFNKFVIGAAYLGLKQYEESIEFCDQSLEFLPDYFEVYLNRGYARYNLGDLVLAEQDLSKAIELEPTCLVAFIVRSRVRMQIGGEEYKNKALEDANKVIELEPNYSLGYKLRASIYHSLNRWDDKEKDLLVSEELPERFKSYSENMTLIQYATYRSITDTKMS